MKDNGFSLIELITVMAIIAILTAVAIPQYSDYKRRAFDSRAVTDLRNVATSEEMYFLDNEEYLSCQNQSCAELPGIGAISDGVTLQITASESSFLGAASHPRGAKHFLWDSEKGGLQD